MKTYKDMRRAEAAADRLAGQLDPHRFMVVVLPPEYARWKTGGRGGDRWGVTVAQKWVRP